MEKPIKASPATTASRGKIIFLLDEEEVSLTSPSEISDGFCPVRWKPPLSLAVSSPKISPAGVGVKDKEGVGVLVGVKLSFTVSVGAEVGSGVGVGVGVEEGVILAITGLTSSVSPAEKVLVSCQSSYSSFSSLIVC